MASFNMAVSAWPCHHSSVSSCLIFFFTCIFREIYISCLVPSPTPHPPPSTLLLALLVLSTPAFNLLQSPVLMFTQETPPPLFPVPLCAVAPPRFRPLFGVSSLRLEAAGSSAAPLSSGPSGGALVPPHRGHIGGLVGCCLVVFVG